MLQRVKEQIRVALIFGPGSKIRPVWFDRQGRKYPIKEVTYTWQERQGEATILHFAVSDGSDLYELSYNTASQLWALSAEDGK
jgi:hypothetical protein